MERISEQIKYFFKLVYLTFVRDLRFFAVIIRLLLRLKWSNQAVVTCFDKACRKNPMRTAIIYQGRDYSFQEIENLANKISNWFEQCLHLGCDDEYEKQQQIKQREEEMQQQQGQENENLSPNVMNLIRRHQNSIKIGLMFGNVPEFASFLIGIGRVRCASVLFNFNHRSDLLVNAFEASNCKIFIFESKYLSAIKEIATRLPDGIRLIMYDRNIINQNNDGTTSSKHGLNLDYKGFTREDLINDNIVEADEKFSQLLDSYPVTSVQKNYPYKINDIFSYIFTSGTTGGKIKAAAVNNYRFLGINYLMDLSFGLKTSDNFYVCVPIYHGMGAGMGIGSTLVNGNITTLVEKFSASKFWKDCYENKCTAALYIGELCRILLARPPGEYDRKHMVKKFIGVSMNKKIWTKFIERFGIQDVHEYYGSTEGNAILFNLMQVPGACGFLPYYYEKIMRLFYPIQFLKVDPDTKELVRDQNGLCITAKPGETGMLVGVIRQNVQSSHFLGYSSVKESSKKLIKNVRQKGDYAFVSGDLMEMDCDGNLYFKDRTGDTFRWKGENVSTTEVETIISQFIDHKDCVVYGVALPGYPGRCGMVSLTDRNLDLEKFYDWMKTRAPQYAIPKFIRFVDQIETTTTHKYIKYSLRNDGIDLDRLKSNEQIYYFDRDNQRYQLMDKDAYEKIINGTIRF
ncbi:long-chain fatty acid transport protein 4 [Dermatophagoides farinae]|uniref:long-chain fatty acid transport protein 4 n=1 Tax=Dermatophagoides farinae TaxID=6954 RepID=UPI003F606D8C